MSRSQNKRRLAVILNYLSIIIILAVFNMVKLLVLKTAYIALEIVPIIAIITSFRYAFGKTNFWKMTHSSFKKLDEREVQVVFKATSISYSLFVIITLVIIYIFIVSGIGKIDALLAASLLYIAHILPASIIAWTEK